MDAPKLLPSLDITVTSAKKKTKVDQKILPDVAMDVVHIAHQPIQMSNDDLFELYTVNRFVLVKARMLEKRPVFSGWTKSTFEDNDKIDSNVAVVCGEKSGIFVLDVDTKDDGFDWFRGFCSANSYSYTTSTMCVQTPSGGLHLYFKYTESINYNSVRMKTESGREVGLDIRSNEGCVIAPPSSYPAGSYTFLCILSPRPCPDFLLTLLSQNI